jgi:S1-C subfamily serine protease
VLPGENRTIVPVSQQVTISPNKSAEAIIAAQGRSIVLLATNGAKGITPVGTGVILTNDGVVVSTHTTNQNELSAIQDDGSVTPLTYIGQDALSGLFFFRIADRIVTPITLAQRSPSVGSELLGLFRDPVTMREAASHVTISSLIPSSPGTALQQVASTISSLPLVSGTALLNDDGHLAALVQEEHEKTAILVPDIAAALTRLSTQTLNQNSFADAGFEISWSTSPDTTGALAVRAHVSDVTPKKSAAVSGLKKGDIVTAVNGNAVTWDTPVSDALQKTPVTLSVLRDGEVRTIVLTPVP